MSATSLTLARQLVDRLAELAHDVSYDHAQLGDLGVFVAGQRVHALQFEGHVGQRLGDAVVELAGDAGALGFRAEGAQPSEPPRVVDGKREQAREALHEVALLGPVRVRRDVLEGDQTHERAPGPQRHVHAAAAERGEPVFVGVHEAVGDQYRVHARQRALERLRELAVDEARAEAHAFGELDGPRRFRVVANEHDQRAEAHEGTQALAHRVDHLGQVERRRERLRETVQRDEELVGGRHLGGLVDGRGAVALDLGDEVAGERAERTAEEVDDGDLARRAPIGRVDRLHEDRRAGRHRTGDERSDGGPPTPHVAGEEEAGDGCEHEGTGQRAGAQGARSP